MPEPCPHCGVLDALGRHAGDCSYAIEIGLPRLADGEEPIAPDEMGEPVPAESATEEEDELEAHARVWPQARSIAERERPEYILREHVELWMAYGDGDDGFDVYVFGSELEALRHAVKVGWRVMMVELGKSLRAQARGDEYERDEPAHEPAHD